MTNRPYVESLVFLGGISADVRTTVGELPNDVEPIAWGKRATLSPGGRAAGAAVAAVRLGRRFVDLMGCVGDDFIGQSILGSLKEEGVSTRHVETVANVPTGIQHTVTERGGDRLMVGAANANAYCLEDQIHRADSAILGSDMMFVTLEVPLATVKRATRTAAGRGVPILLDATPFPTANGTDDLDRAILARADVLLVNWNAAQYLAGMVGSAGPFAVELAQRLLNNGPKAVVITMGQHGAMVAANGRHSFVAAMAESSLDASAAGDAFAGGLAVGLTNQAPKNWRWDQLVRAVQFASATAAVCVSRHGAQSSLPSREDVERLLIGHA